ncbi:hypothetical protein HX004_10535 [Myroides sp. 1354]|uniref:hypothetical protein n=1 Tax=unclassified Myroides TaxID=2642485 RepID=UPI0025753FBD|nr:MULTISPECIES: hypothetical protein [unclassified Myroides]MDM1044333.1 hypothetical protein [Myroides sp. R163-1]MDM1056207.1 hypothetical protein [Myroides sp. 1354]MDM1069437.1 hypothetical protein [Myroides sp. 1372]
MYKKILAVAFFTNILFLYSCSEKKDQVKTEDYTQSKEKSIDIELYSQNALEILSRHKEGNLQVVLPNIIYDQVKIYDNLLVEYEKKQIYAKSDIEFLNYKEEIDNLALVSLLMKDIEVNLAYTELVSEIEDLNIAYSKKFNISLEKLNSFYDLDNIILSEEVLLKIKEFSQDEKQRIKIQEKDDLQALGTDGIVLAAGLIPGGSLITKGALRGLSQGAKLAKQGKNLSVNASAITKETYKIMSFAGNTKLGASTRNKVVKILSNEVKRQVLAERQLINAKRLGTALAIRRANELANVSPSKINRSKEYFKVIENKLEGRVGDYSDGILAVHLQNMRELIKKNQLILSELK